MKHEWRKKEKDIYLPKNKPEQLILPAFKYITLSGAGNPNSSFFAECIGVLYSMAYAIKMSMKKLEKKPEGYVDWTVYPLEGVWDITEKAKKNFSGQINKDDLVFTLMIRQPGFVDTQFFHEILLLTKKRKPHKLLDHVQLETIKDGPCIQMLHIGSYDDEPSSFEQMEVYAAEQNLKRISKVHREIYLSDFRKVPVEKLKTVLRFQVTPA